MLIKVMIRDDLDVARLFVIHQAQALFVAEPVRPFLSLVDGSC